MSVTHAPTPFHSVYNEFWQHEQPRPNTSVTSESKAIETTTRWKGSTERSETGRRLCED
jgi:hypothetical protein